MKNNQFSNKIATEDKDEAEGATGKLLTYEDHKASGIR